MPMQRSIQLMARLVRLLVDLKAGLRVGARSAMAQTQGATSGVATVGRGLKNVTSQGAVLKDLTSGGRNFWAHMPKAPGLPGGLADAAHMSTQREGEEEGWEGPSGLDDTEALLDVLEGNLPEVDLTSMRTDTPADMLLSILSDMADGRQPDLREVALVRSVLLRHADLYAPLNSGGHIRAADLDADVVGALMIQLGAGGAAEQPPPSPPAPPQQQQQQMKSPGGLAGQRLGSGHAAPGGTEYLGERLAGQDEDETEGAAIHSLADALALLLLAPPQTRMAAAALEPAGAEGSSSGSGSDCDCSPWSRGSSPAVPSPLLDEVERALAGVDDWQFDTWRLAEATQGHALSCLGFHLLQREGLVGRFRLQPAKLARLLRTLESGYAPNPYHNAVHAADVLQTLHVLLRGSGLRQHYLDPTGLLAAYFAAIVHDHGHPGLTADFLIATSDPLALRYNDRSPLENHHGASFFGLLATPGLDALGSLAPAERAAFRRAVLDLVMATDMKQHFALLAHFNTAHGLAPYSKEAGPRAQLRQRRPRGSRSGAAWPPGEGLTGPDGAEAGAVSGCEVPRPLDETERVLSLQIALKVADLGHLGEELGVHKRWVRALEEEFFAQGDRERERGLPISPLFDRAKQGVSKSQVGFFDFIALPLATALAAAFPGAQPLLECFVNNYEHWRQVEKAAAAGGAVADMPAAAVPAR